MTISQIIAPHLPHLRRFARSLSGNQNAGDSYAVATLEAIIAEPASFDVSLNPRLALYKVFLRVWQSVSVNGQAHAGGGAVRFDDGDAAASGQQKLLAMTPLSRIAFLLNAVEGFDVQQIAEALGCTPAKASEYLSDSATELASQIRTDVLIIEDEPMIAMDIETMVENLGHRVTAIARTHAEAVAAAAEARPGLILADIHLADGSSGLNAVNDILQAFDVPVIFITAYPERLLTGERPEPTFLIAKPYLPEMVKAVISQALFFDQKSTHSASFRRSAV